MQDMCERLILEHRSLESLNAEDCLEEIEQMEKEGAKFMNVNKMDVHKKKRKGAIIGAAVMTLLMVLTIGIICWGKLTRSNTDLDCFCCWRDTGSDHCGNSG